MPVETVVPVVTEPVVPDTVPETVPETNVIIHVEEADGVDGTLTTRLRHFTNL